MAKIIGNIVGIPNPQSDWNQNDPSKADYIKNKPDLGDIETALDSIIAIQNELIGGDS